MRVRDGVTVGVEEGVLVGIKVAVKVEVSVAVGMGDGVDVNVVVGARLAVAVNAAVGSGLFVIAVPPLPVSGITRSDSSTPGLEDPNRRAGTVKAPMAVARRVTRIK